MATPIGNLEDVTLRALRVLREADLLLAEDTRRTRILLERHGIRRRPRSLHAHNEAERIREVVRLLDAGGSVALVSDAGTPLISDPGERLAAAVVAAGHAVVPVPGPSALLAALVGSGLPTAAFTFMGFLPRRAGLRRRLLESLRDRAETIVLFESPKRLRATLRALRESFGDRPACIAREITKRHEEWLRGTLAELAEQTADDVRGEVTIVVAGAVGPALLAGEALEREVRSQIDSGVPVKAIAAALAPRAEATRSEIYAMAVAMRGQE